MSRTENIQITPVTKQVKSLPADVVEELKTLYETGGITMGMVLEMLQEKGFIAEGVKYMTFYSAMANIHKFKQQIHGFLTESEYIATWDYEKNEEEGIFPDRLTLKSVKSAWFKCGAGIHPSEKRRIDSHTSGNGCKQCGIEAASIANSTPKPGRSLAEMYPLVAAEFKASGNEISPKNVAAKSDKVFAFTPSCGNSLHRPYSQRVCDRTKNEDKWLKNGHHGSWCPWCSNEKESAFHGQVTEFISSLIPLDSGSDLLVNQMVLPDDNSLPDGARQGSELDFLSWDLGLAVEIHGYNHDYDPEGYTESKKIRAEALGLDFFVIWQKDWDDPETQEYLKEQLRAIVGFKVMDYLKSQSRAVSNSFWNGDAA